MALRRLRSRRSARGGHVQLNDIDAQAWLADVLARIAALPAARLDELLPWNWHPAVAHVNQAA